MPSQPRFQRNFIGGVDAARASSAGLEEEEGAGEEAAPRGATTTEEERKAEILRQVTKSATFLPKSIHFSKLWIDFLYKMLERKQISYDASQLFVHRQTYLQGHNVRWYRYFIVHNISISLRGMCPSSRSTSPTTSWDRR